MRNLKRALSLTLASVMLLGMMVVGTSALSFNDADGISNVTAATVLEELKVMQGDGKGNFMPEQSVTRAQMAILVCRILYGNRLNVKQFEGVTSFNDVPANEYYTGYINLASSLGIINGYGDGRFGPDDTVTTAQAALMLCRALGYFKAGEMTGDWGTDALTAIAQATKIDMFGELDLATNDLLARDNVAEMVFNAMTKAVPVQYSERWGLYYTDSTNVLGGTKFDYINTLGYQNFDLVYSENKVDDFGRPATEWGIVNGSISTDKNTGDIVGNPAIKTSFIKSSDTADATYTAEVKSEDIYKDLGLDKTVSAKQIVDGKNAASFSIAKNNDTKLGGNGVLIEAYKDDDNNVTLTVINPYSGKIAKVDAARGNNARSVSVDGLKFETEDFEKDDVVVYTKADDEIKSMYLAKTVTGAEVTRKTGTSNFVAGGDTYKYAKLAANAVDTDDVTVDSVLDLWLDKYGYVVKVDIAEGSTSYAYVIEIGQDAGRFGSGTPYAKLLLTDGTVVEAKLDYDDYSGDDTESHLEELFENFIVEYSKNSKDVYKLTAKSSELASAGTAVEIETGKAAMKLNGVTYYADSKTIFLVKTSTTKDQYAVYTGYNSVPKLVHATAGQTAVYCKAGTVATVVYVQGASVKSSDILFLLGSECSKVIKEAGKDDYYECDAVLNGEMVTVKLDESINTDRLWGTLVYSNTEEEILDVSACETYETDDDADAYYFTGTVSKSLSNGIIQVTSKGSYVVDSSATAFVYDDDIRVSAPGSVQPGDSGFFVVKDGKIVSIFYSEDKTASEDNEGLESADIFVTGDLDGLTVLHTSNKNNSQIGAAVQAYLETEFDMDNIESAVVAADGSKVTVTFTDGSKQEIGLTKTAKAKEVVTAAKAMTEIQNLIESASDAADKPDSSVVTVTVDGNKMTATVDHTNAEYFAGTGANKPNKSLHDLARFLGKLYTEAGAKEIKYTRSGGEKTYTWDATKGGDSASHWYTAGSTNETLVKSITEELKTTVSGWSTSKGTATLNFTVDGAPMVIEFVKNAQ